MINKQKLQENFAKMATFTLAGEGITRLAFSAEDWQARQFVINLMKQANLQVRIDSFGNVIGRLEGNNLTAPVVMLGSHIDSVPNGGNFDGVVGVLSAIEVVNCLQENNIDIKNPVEIVVFMAEESSRFGVATLGSKALCGRLNIADLKKIIDKKGNILYDVLRSLGLDADNIANNKYNGLIKTFLELHIEQGKVLESTKKQVGVVTGIAAPTRLKVFIYGNADHSGATPMHLRKDGLCTAAEIILQVEKLATATNDNCVGTVGVIDVRPGVMNVVPGKVELGIDIRSIFVDEKDMLVEKLQQAISNIAKNRNLAIDVEVTANEQPVKITTDRLDFLENICKEQNIDFIKLPSGAGHDAMNMVALTDVGMFFIPCKDGISHHNDEYADIDDIVVGTKVLYEAVVKLCC